MHINKDELKNALELVSPGLTNDADFEQGNSFAFVGDRVITYNNQISISHRVKGLNLTGVTNSKPLYDLVSKLKDDKIELTNKENEIILKNGKATAGLPLILEVKLPEINISKKKWKDIPDGFADALAFTVNACGNDTERPILTCVFIDKKTLIASDSFKLIKHTIKSKMPVDAFLIPEISAKLVAKMKPVQIYKDKSWVHFKTEKGTVISCRLFKDKYPNIVSILEMEGKSLHLPKELQDVLQKANVFSKRSRKENEVIDITIAKNKLTLESKSDEGWFKEQIEIEYNKKELQFMLSPYILTDILSLTNKCLINKTKIKFISDSWEYVGVLKVQG